jgi:cell division septum initiation protein DivIVA
MALTPVEIRHIHLHKSLLGYHRTQTDELLEDVVASFEDVWRDRADLADKVEHLEAELVRYKELEHLLRTTLISAERASQQMTDQARRQSDAILSEAHAEAREIVRRAMAQREALMGEALRIRTQLEATLRSIGAVTEEEPPAQPQAPEAAAAQAPAQQRVTPPPARAQVAPGPPPRPAAAPRPALPRPAPGQEPPASTDSSAAA